MPRCCSLGWFPPAFFLLVAWKQVEGTARSGMTLVAVHGWQPVIIGIKGFLRSRFFLTGRIKAGESLCFVGVLGSNARSAATLGVCGPPAGSATLAAAGSLPAQCATDQQPARPRRLLLLVSLACFCPLVWADVPPLRSSAICLVASPVPLPQRGVTSPILCAEPALGAPIPSRNGKGMWVTALLDPPYKAWLAVPALALGSEDLAPFPLARMVLLVPEDLPQPNLGIRCAGRTQTFTE